MKLPQQKFIFDLPTPCVFCGNEVKELWASSLEIAQEGRGICSDCKLKNENKALPGVQYSLKDGD